jgi:hypothetical protein
MERFVYELGFDFSDGSCGIHWVREFFELTGSCGFFFSSNSFEEFFGKDSFLLHEWFEHDL